LAAESAIMRAEPSESSENVADRLAARLQISAPLFEVTRPPATPDQASPPSSRATERRAPASSLRKICCAILQKYRWAENEEICLKNLASELGTERRRVYDIVNILEAFDILAKKAKNVYIWRGLDEFRNKLGALGLSGPRAEPAKVFNFEQRPVKSKKKMLTYMSLRVLRFFGHQTQSISFGEIVRLCLCGDSQKDYLSEKRASTTRRLYDIVNVLNALGLISKVYDDQHKKFYRWNGPDGMAVHSSQRPFRLPKPISPIRKTEQRSEARAEPRTEFRVESRPEQGFTLLPGAFASPSVHLGGPPGVQTRNRFLPFPVTVAEPRVAPLDENTKETTNADQPKPRFKGFQPCKDFGLYPVTEIKRLLSFSETEGSSTGK